MHHQCTVPLTSARNCNGRFFSFGQEHGSHASTSRWDGRKHWMDLPFFLWLLVFCSLPLIWPSTYLFSFCIFLYRAVFVLQPFACSLFSDTGFSFSSRYYLRSLPSFDPQYVGAGIATCVVEESLKARVKRRKRRAGEITTYLSGLVCCQRNLPNPPGVVIEKTSESDPNLENLETRA